MNMEYDILYPTLAGLELAICSVSSTRQFLLGHSDKQLIGLCNANPLSSGCGIPQTSADNQEHAIANLVDLTTSHQMHPATLTLEPMWHVYYIIFYSNVSVTFFSKADHASLRAILSNGQRLAQSTTTTIEL